MSPSGVTFKDDKVDADVMPVEVASPEDAEDVEVSIPPMPPVALETSVDLIPPVDVETPVPAPPRLALEPPMALEATVELEPPAPVDAPATLVTPPLPLEGVMLGCWQPMKR